MPSCPFCLSSLPSLYLNPPPMSFRSPTTTGWCHKSIPPQPPNVTQHACHLKVYLDSHVSLNSLSIYSVSPMRYHCCCPTHAATATTCALLSPFVLDCLLFHFFLVPPSQWTPIPHLSFRHHAAVVHQDTIHSYFHSRHPFPLPLQHCMGLSPAVPLRVLVYKSLCLALVRENYQIELNQDHFPPPSYLCACHCLKSLYDQYSTLPLCTFALPSGLRTHIGHSLTTLKLTAWASHLHHTANVRHLERTNMCVVYAPSHVGSPIECCPPPLPVARWSSIIKRDGCGRAE